MTRNPQGFFSQFFQFSQQKSIIDMTERETNWEEVELMDATHVEINGVVHEITERGGMVIKSMKFGWIDILIEENKWANIPQEAFPLEDRFPNNFKKTKFRCVEILEEE